MDLMTSGEFQARTRLSAKALRVYREQAVLKPVTVDPSNNYRYYGEEQIKDARLIILLRGLEMPLAVIRRVLAHDDSGRADAITTYWNDVEADRSGQRHLAAYVVSVLSPERKQKMTVQTRMIEEATYFTERRRVGPQEIPGFIRESCGRLAVIAERHGGWAGPLTTIYRSEVNEETDGEVENAVPVHAGVSTDDVTAPTNILVEPAAEIAYVRITTAQVKFPQILQPYDEVFAWLDERKFTATSDPREIYFADFGTAAPDDEICDIAVPFRRSDEPVDRP